MGGRICSCGMPLQVLGKPFDGSGAGKARFKVWSSLVRIKEAGTGRMTVEQGFGAPKSRHRRIYDSNFR